MPVPKMSASTCMAVPRRIFGLIGYTSLLLGAIGIVLPLLPTTPFVLLSVWAFTRYNPAIADRLLHHPRLGPPLRDWHDAGVISTRAKAQALVALAASWLVIWMTASGTTIPILVAVVFGCVIVFSLSRPSQPSTRRRSRRCSPGVNEKTSA
jgi:uncharacterized membrane protein YbaN (DUF454 family)